MSIEKNKQLMHRYFEELLNTGDSTAADRLLAPSFICHLPGVGTLDREGYKQFILGFHAGFPGLHTRPQDMIAEGDQVAVRFTLSGTHQGSWQGVPATGKQVNVLGICIYRIAHDQIVEKWLLMDGLGMLQQLGEVPVR
ncbi:MAG TPA: ester cyclase [Chloroflexota bacterium]|nr:ester cyclase [Chloroflexota bacterium]